MHVVVSCETTGKPKYHGVDENHPSQPHVVRVAAIALHPGGEEHGMCDLVIPRDDWEFEPGAVGFHGIDPSIAAERGKSLHEVARRLNYLMVESGEPITIVAFGLDFQVRVLKRFFAEAGMEPPPAQGFCCMKEAITLVRKPRMQPGGGHTNPSFSEAYRHFTGDTLPVFANMDPIDGGLEKVRAVCEIYMGIVAARARGTP